MNSRNLALALLAMLLPLLVPSLAHGEDGEVPAEDPGCSFLLVGPNYTRNAPASDCGTDVRVSIMGFNGACVAPPGQDAPCFVGVNAEYRSHCPVTLRYEMGPLGQTQGQFPLPSTGGVWDSIVPPFVESLPCGSPMYFLKAELTDITGFMTLASAQYRCTACD